MKKKIFKLIFKKAVRIAIFFLLTVNNIQFLFLGLPQGQEKLKRMIKVRKSRET